MKTIFVILLLAGLLAGGWWWSLQVEPENGIRIDNPRIRLAPPGTPLAGYFTLRNAGDGELLLLGAASGRFAAVTLHETMRTGPQTGMRPIESGVPVPAGATVEFAPGGKHLMLMQPDRPLEVGDQVRVELRLQTPEGATRSLGVPFTVVPLQP